MSGSELEIVDLDAMVRPVGRVLFQKTRHDVIPINGRGADLLQQIAVAKNDGTQQTWLPIARSIIMDCIPTLSSEQVLLMSIEQVTAVIGIATKQADRIKHFIQVMEGNESTPENRPILDTPDQPFSVPLALS